MFDSAHVCTVSSPSFRSSPVAGHRAAQLEPPPIRHRPVPILLVQRGPGVGRLSYAIARDSRFEALATTELTRDWIGLGNRVRAVVIADVSDPVNGLLYAITAGIKVPVVVACQRSRRTLARDLMAAGAVACIAFNPSRSDLTRLLAIATRARGESTIHTTGHLLLDPIGRVARYGDRSVRLTQREFGLLHRLTLDEGRPVPVADLFTYAWADKAPRDSHQIVAVYVFQLRKKLERLGLGDTLSTIRGFGYALLPPKQHSL